jgi:hypothetical protein
VLFGCNICFVGISFLKIYIAIAACIDSGNRIIATVGKHIIAQDALAGRNECVGIDESAQFGIVIAGLEIVERGFSVVYIAAVARGAISLRESAIVPLRDR